MKGPFIATAQIDGPFRIQSEPYTIVASAVEGRMVLTRIIWLIVVILAVAIAYVIVRLVRTKQTQ